jgi:hypothetical protein
VHPNGFVTFGEAISTQSPPNDFSTLKSPAFAVFWTDAVLDPSDPFSVKHLI